MDLFLWQGFRHRWEAFPHRLGALASAITDVHTGRRVAGVYPGINGDTGRLDHHAARLVGLPDGLEARGSVIELGFYDVPQAGGTFRAHGAASGALEVALPPGHAAVALLQGFEWYPCAGPGEDAASRDGRVDRARPVWPTAFEVGVSLAGGLMGHAAITHEDCADPLKRPQAGALWHRVRLHTLVLHGPPELLAVTPLVLLDEARVGHRRRLPGARHAVQGTVVPALTGLSLRLGTRWGRRQGRYLSEVAARVEGQGDHVRAGGGWRGGGLPAPAWRESRVEGALLGLPDGVSVQTRRHVDPFRFVLPAGGAGREPRGPHVRVTGPDDRAVVEVGWGEAAGAR